MIRAPRARAMSGVASRLKESSTTTSSLQATESRQPARFTSSSSVRMSTEIDMASPSGRISTPHRRALPDHARRMTCDDGERLHILHDDGACTHQSSRPDSHSGTDEGLGADPRIIGDRHGRLEQRNRRIGEIMRTGTDVRAVGDGGAAADANLPQAIDVYLRTDRRPVADLDIPWHEDVGGGGDPRLESDFGTEEAQHPPPPAVTGVRAKAHEPT